MTGDQNAAKSTKPAYDPTLAFHLTENLDPEWTLGSGMRETSALAREWKEDEKQGWKSFNLDQMDKPDVYPMLISAITPRPIAFISTLSENGERNLAPFSYFNVISHNPPLVIVSFNIPPKGFKDTPTNIKSTKEFVVNMISEPFLEAANATAIDAPADVDEWVVSGLTPEPSEFVKPPRVRESAVSFECTLYHYMDIHSPSSPSPAPPTHVLVIGLIRRAHIRNSVLSPDGSARVDPARFRAVSRMGGGMYARVGPSVDLTRPSWRENAEAVHSLKQQQQQQQQEGEEDARQHGETRQEGEEGRKLPN